MCVGEGFDRRLPASVAFKAHALDRHPQNVRATSAFLTAQASADPVAGMHSPMAPSPWRIPPLAALCALFLSSNAAPLESCLAPGDTARDHFIRFDMPAEYCLRGVHPDATYELKISYRHTDPTVFAMSIVSHDPIDSRPPGARGGGHGGRGEGGAEEDGAKAGETPGSGAGSSVPKPRADLDMEKLVFRTESNGSVVYLDGLPGHHVVPGERAYLRIEARERGKPYFAGAAGKATPRVGTRIDLRFDVVYFGFLPATALPLFYLVPIAAVLASVAGRWLLTSKSSPFAGLQGAAAAAAEGGKGGAGPARSRAKAS